MSADVTPAVRRAAAAMGPDFRKDLSRCDALGDFPDHEDRPRGRPGPPGEIARALYDQHCADVEWQTGGSTPSAWADVEQGTGEWYLEQADVVIAAILGDSPLRPPVVVRLQRTARLCDPVVGPRVRDDVAGALGLGGIAAGPPCTCPRASRRPTSFRLHLEAALTHPAETVVRRPHFSREYSL